MTPEPESLAHIPIEERLFRVGSSDYASPMVRELCRDSLAAIQARRTPDLTEAPLTRFRTALAAWREVKGRESITAEDDYQGFNEFRALRAAARGLAAFAYREAMLPVEDVPDLTEALARLKALEERMRAPVFVGAPSVEIFGVRTVVMPHLAKWADEIAAIITKLEGK